MGVQCALDRLQSSGFVLLEPTDGDPPNLYPWICLVTNVYHSIIHNRPAVCVQEGLETAVSQREGLNAEVMRIQRDLDRLQALVPQLQADVRQKSAQAASARDELRAAQAEADAARANCDEQTARLVTLEGELEAMQVRCFTSYDRRTMIGILLGYLYLEFDECSGLSSLGGVARDSR